MGFVLLLPPCSVNHILSYLPKQRRTVSAPLVAAVELFLAILPRSPAGPVLGHSDAAVEGFSAGWPTESCLCEGAGNTGVCGVVRACVSVCHCCPAAGCR